MKERFDVIVAWVANGSVLAFTSVANVKEGLQITLLCLTIIYTVKQIWFSGKQGK